MLNVKFYVEHYSLQKYFHTPFACHNISSMQPWNILELLTPKSKLYDNRCYMHCVKQYLLCTNQWLRWCFESSCMWIKASKALTVSMRVFRGQIPGLFSLSKINIAPAAPDNNNNNNVHLSCAHQRPKRSHDTY